MKKIFLPALGMLSFFQFAFAQIEIRKNAISTPPIVRAAPPPDRDAPPAVVVGSDFRKMTVGMCSLKAMEAMIYQQHFLHSRIVGADAGGFNEKSFAIVHAVPVKDGVQIFVVAFSWIPQEAERLRNAVRQHVFNGNYNPNIPTHYHDNISYRMPFFIRWTNFSKYGEMTGTEKWFHPCAVHAMTSNQLKETHNGNQIIFGKNETASVVVTGVGVINVKLNGVIPVTEYLTNVIVIATSFDRQSTDRLVNNVKSSMDCPTL